MLAGPVVVEHGDNNSIVLICRALVIQGQNGFLLQQEV